MRHLVSGPHTKLAQPVVKRALCTSLDVPGRFAPGGCPRDRLSDLESAPAHSSTEFRSASICSLEHLREWLQYLAGTARRESRFACKR